MKSRKEDKSFQLSCPLPIQNYPKVLLGHGSGGTLMHQLLDKMILPVFDAGDGLIRHDSTVVPFDGARLAVTTDSFVVNPLFFPGGNIGSLAVHGTVNDLAMSGAKPIYMTVGLILEEGLPMESLWDILQSMRCAADEAGVKIISGDTKVVEKGKGDGVFINTTGIGMVDDSLSINSLSIRPGDAIIINGDIGRHGITIMAAREGLSFESQIESDSAALNNIVEAVIKSGIKIHCMRDCTRGGLASTLVEISREAKLKFIIDQNNVPVDEIVHGACEILGFDPMYVANEGRFICFVPEKEKEKALKFMRDHALGHNAQIIGHVTEEKDSTVIVKSLVGTNRILDMLSGEQLPRIC